MTTYTTLRAANEARQTEWEAHGVLYDIDWRMNELMGEVGEVCNVLKKLQRAKTALPGAHADREMLADELADVLICLDLLLMSLRCAPAALTYDLISTNTLPAQGRKLYITVSQLDAAVIWLETTVLENAPVAPVLLRANDVYSRCWTLARSENIDMLMAIEKKFNETSRKMGFATLLHFPN